jgi:hypothetical protein
VDSTVNEAVLERRSFAKERAEMEEKRPWGEMVEKVAKGLQATSG